MTILLPLIVEISDLLDCSGLTSCCGAVVLFYHGLVKMPVNKHILPISNIAHSR